MTYGELSFKVTAMEKDIKAVQEALVKADRIAVLTGAGISAESGVPTFRGEDGLWRNHNVMDLVTPQGFARDPELVWEFYNWRRDLISKITYNPAHRALVDLESRVPDFTLITQNVDGLHLKAGSENLLEIHGNLWKLCCTRCYRITLDYSSNMGPLPKCGECGGLLRPHVVWFGESLDYDLLQQAIRASKNAQLMLVIGTSAVVQPAASLAMEAKGAGAVVVEINLEKTPQTGHMDFAIQGKAGEIVPNLLENWP